MADQGTVNRAGWLGRVGRAVAGAALVVVGWVCLTQWGGVAHGHPA